MGGPPVPSKASRTLEEVFKSTKCFLLKKAWLPRRAPRHSQTDPGLPGTVGAIRIACGRGRELLHGKACRARPSPHHRQRVLCVGAGVGINVSALVGPHTSTAVQNPARCARHEGAEEPQPDEAGRCWGGGGDLGGPASPPCGVPSACRSHSRSLYLVNRLYRTLSVDLRSRFTTSAGGNRDTVGGGSTEALVRAHGKHGAPACPQRSPWFKDRRPPIQDALGSAIPGQAAKRGPRHQPALRAPVTAGQGHSRVLSRPCIGQVQGQEVPMAVGSPIAKDVCWGPTPTRPTCARTEGRPSGVGEGACVCKLLLPPAPSRSSNGLHGLAHGKALGGRDSPQSPGCLLWWEGYLGLFLTCLQP